MGEALDIRANDRVAVVGQTGTGKSYGALSLLATCHRLVVCNVKGQLPDPPDGWPGGWQLLPESEWERGLKLLEQGKPARVVIPSQAPGDWNAIFIRLHRMRGLIVYLDEVIGTGTQTGTLGLDLLLAQGRGLGIGVWCATQRPAGINKLILTQADWILGFRVQGADDQERMADAMQLDEYPALDKEAHHCLIYNPAYNAPRWCVLET